MHFRAGYDCAQKVMLRTRVFWTEKPSLIDFFMTSPVEMNAAEDVADSGRKCDSGVSQR